VRAGSGYDPGRLLTSEGGGLTKGGVPRLSSIAVAVFSCLFSLPALAQEGDNESWDGGYKIKAERRSDFVFGASLGLVLGGASGHPNEIAKINDPAYEATTGLAIGPGGSMWIGGALRDWFTVGVGGTYFGMTGGSGTGSGGAFTIRVEAFPLYPWGGLLRDLAFFGVFGAGGYTVRADDGNRGEGGFMSLVGLGSAFELLRLGPVALAPTAEYMLVRSQSATAHQVILGIRAVAYAGP